VSSFSWLRGVMRATSKQKDHEDDNACIIIFMVEKNCDDYNSTRRRLIRR